MAPGDLFSLAGEYLETHCHNRRGAETQGEQARFSGLDPTRAA